MARASTEVTPRHWLLVRAATLALVPTLLGCDRSHPQPEVVVSPLRDFSEVFVPVDTIRLDASVTVGAIRFVDVSSSGELLISDRIAGDFKLFSRQGEFIRSLQGNECAPGKQLFPTSARFVGGGRILAQTGDGAVLFGADGTCLKRVTYFARGAYSFCERNDSLFAYSVSRGVPGIHIYSSSLDLMDEFETVAPLRPVLTRIFRGLPGREIACLAGGIFYTYPERSDARRIDERRIDVIFRPPYFKAPTRDRSSGGQTGDLAADGQELRKESTLNIGVFELDDQTRVVVFDAYQTGRRLRLGLNIVRADERSVSTYLTKGPLAAKDGFLYLLGDHETLASGDVGNQMIEKYEFVDGSLK